MSVTDNDLRAVWQQGSREVPSDRSACLREVEWTRLLTKEASEAERGRGADHISSCAECAEEYRLLLPLESWAAEVQQVLPRDNTTQRADSMSWLQWFAWPRSAATLAGVTILLAAQAVSLYLVVASRRQNVRLESQLAQDQHALSSTQDSLRAVQEELARDKYALSSTRASLDAVQNELRRRPASPRADQLNALQQRVAQLSTPRLDAVIVDLDPLAAIAPGEKNLPASRQAAGRVRGLADPTTATIKPSAFPVTLILNFAPLLSRSTLEVDVLGPDGHSRWVGRAECDRSTASLTLALPTQGYAAGRYEIRVFDVTHGRTRFATYAVSIQASPAKSP